MKNYTVYHLHSDLSLLDSCTKFKDYVDKAKEYGMRSIGWSEHGNIYNWVEKKMYCDKNNIKYLHGCEVYLTETLEDKIRDNYHTILISVNYKGFKELNSLIDKSTQEDHIYYKNRISFDEFLNISDNIIKISSCMASPLNRLSENNPYYEKLLKHYDYYEIQYHNDKNGEQSAYNKKLYEYSKKYNKKLIVGTDTHSISKYKAECRSILKTAKKMSYDDEDSYDLTFKSYDELVKKFKEQNSLPIEVVLEAIENTNIMADSVEDLILDTTCKYPILSENDEDLFITRIYEKYEEKIEKGIIPQDERYLINLKEEIRVFKKLNMCSFMLFMSELCTWCNQNNIPIGFCRGSVGGSIVAYILDIIDVNPIQWNTVFSRFCNEDRVEVGDIDLDFSPSQRELVYEYITNRFTIDKSAYILAIGTISDKGTIDEIGRALNYPLSDVANIKKIYEEDSEKARKEFKELFYYFDGLINTSISQSIHPAGIVASPITLPDNYGCFWSKDKRILQINMEEVHEIGLVKYDILGLKNIEIIKDVYSLLGLPYPKSHEINWVDANAWNDIISSPVGIFQFEGSYAYDLLKKYKPKKINDLSLVNASLRPSGTSYRDRLIAGEFNHNPSTIIDDLLKDNNGFLVFQEDVIAFLQKICGLSGSDADNIRRAIGRKQVDRLEKALPSILEGYCDKSDKPREIAEEEAKTFLKIIEDASSYMFGYNHSTGYSMIGYLCGYLRYYYPLEFITAYLNNANNEDDIASGTMLAKQLNIKIQPPKFRYSSSKYTPSKETKSIFKGVSSIKFLNSTVADDLYSLKDNNYNNFYELLKDIKEKTSLNSKQLSILIKLDYFKEFGKAKKLLLFTEYFDILFGKKSPKKDTIAKKISDSSIVNIIEKNSIPTNSTYGKFEYDLCLSEIITNIHNDDLSLLDKINFQKEVLGYIDYTNDKIDKRYVLITETNLKYTPLVDTYCLNNGKTCKCKISKKLFDKAELNVGDVIYINSMSKKFVKKFLGKDAKGKNIFEEDQSKLDWWIESYNKISDIDNLI